MSHKRYICHGCDCNVETLYSVGLMVSTVFSRDYSRKQKFRTVQDREGFPNRNNALIRCAKCLRALGLPVPCQKALESALTQLEGHSNA